MKILITLFLLLFLTLSLKASDKEDAIKGIILERISQFISYENQADRFKICIYDDTRLAKIFKKIYSEKKYKNREIEVAEVSSIGEIKSCSILYAHDLNKKIAKGIVKKLDKNVLLVTQDVDNIYDGFMIAIYFEDNKIKFAINHSAIDSADLKVNYRLLNIASKIINPIKK